MIPPDSFTRRQFVQTSALAAAAFAASGIQAQAAPAPRSWKIIALSKPFAHYSPDETADLLVDVGLDGIECPVRKKDPQVKPERVEEDLPKLVETLKKRGKEATILATDITQIDPSAERILRTMSKLGLKQYRFGRVRYTKDKPVLQTVREVAAALKDVAALNKELGLQGGWQNHSGPDYVGAPVWDIMMALRDLDPKHIGISFDIGHATIEGGLSWPVQARLMEPYYTAVFVKDFYWKKGEKGWEPYMCNLGDGCVPKEFVANLKNLDFSGPICLHCEYKNLGTGAEMIANIKKDVAKLREWLT